MVCVYRSVPEDEIIATRTQRNRNYLLLSVLLALLLLDISTTFTLNMSLLLFADNIIQTRVTKSMSTHKSDRFLKDVLAQSATE